MKNSVFVALIGLLVANSVFASPKLKLVECYMGTEGTQVDTIPGKAEFDSNGKAAFKIEASGYSAHIMVTANPEIMDYTYQVQLWTKLGNKSLRTISSGSFDPAYAMFETFLGERILGEGLRKLGAVRCSVR